MGVGNDTGQRRMGKLAEQFVVIHADDRHLVRHRDADAPAGVEHLLAADVVAGHQADGLGKLAQPTGQGFDVRDVVAGKPARRLVMNALAAFRLRPPAESAPRATWTS